MNALNEVNKVIANVTYYTHKQSGLDEEEYLTAERMAVSKTTRLQWANKTSDFQSWDSKNFQESLEKVNF